MSKALIVLMVGMLAVGCATLTPEEKQQKALRDSVVGEYERKWKGNTDKYVFLDNGIREWYTSSEIDSPWVKVYYDSKWKLTKEGEIHVTQDDDVLIIVFSINKDGSITMIAGIDDGKRVDLSKNAQLTFKKIK